MLKRIKKHRNNLKSEIIEMKTVLFTGLDGTIIETQYLFIVSF